MRAHLFIVALALWLSTSSASADTIQNFEIVTASNLSPIGGTFNDGGTFGGTFSVDLSSLPTVPGPIPLPAVDITTSSTTMFAGSNYISGVLLDGGTASFFGLTLQEYGLELFGVSDSLDLVFVELPGTFTGGQIIQASEVDFLENRLERIDNSGDAIAVDPALVPEPWSATTCALGLLAIWLFRRSNRQAALAD
jgi:hypothetical protein